MAYDDPSVQSIDTSATSGIAAGASGTGSLAALGGPLAFAGAAVGIGLSIYGGLEEARAQKAEAQVSTQIAGYEEQIMDQRRVLAGIQYQRQSIEGLRNAQMAAAKSRAASTGQGAQYSSSARAGEEQAQSESAFTQLGLAQNYQIGQNIFDITGKIDENKIRLAQLGGAAAEGAGLASLGSSITGGSMSMGKLAGGFG